MYRHLASLGVFGFWFYSSFATTDIHHDVCSQHIQEDVPAGEDGSGSSDDSDSDEDDSEEDSSESSEDDDDEEEEKEDEPLSLEWPDTRRKQATYLFLLPIVFPLWLTVPDVRNQVWSEIIFHINNGA